MFCLQGLLLHFTFFSCNRDRASTPSPLSEHFKRGGCRARGPAVTEGSFLAGVHRELSAALIKCQGSVYRGCANLLARAAGRPVSPGAEVPYVD